VISVISYTLHTSSPRRANARGARRRGSVQVSGRIQTAAWMDARLRGHDGNWRHRRVPKASYGSVLANGLRLVETVGALNLDLEMQRRDNPFNSACLRNERVNAVQDQLVADVVPGRQHLIIRHAA
jgi:hypothetical protein